MNRNLIVIPARGASTRFPNKPLALIKGRSMLSRVYQIAKQSTLATDVIIATDDQAIYDHAKSFGANVMMTPSNCATGTDRVANVVKQLNVSFDVIFSLQGDAVLTPPWIIDDILKVMQQDSSVVMATPAVKLTGAPLIAFAASKRSGSTSGTSVVFDKHQNALYFSKALIPMTRNVADNEQIVYRHIGLYAYRQPILEQFNALERGEFEQAEHLEQLRALENGIAIRVVLVDYRGRTHGSVDNPEDIQNVEAIIDKEGELI